MKLRSLSLTGGRLPPRYLLQFMFELGGREEEEVLICLQQEDRRIHRKHGRGENLPIGFEVLKVRLLLQ